MAVVELDEEPERRDTGDVTGKSNLNIAGDFAMKDDNLSVNLKLDAPEISAADIQALLPAIGR